MTEADGVVGVALVFLATVVMPVLLPSLVVVRRDAISDDRCHDPAHQNRRHKVTTLHRCPHSSERVGRAAPPTLEERRRNDADGSYSR